MNIENNETPSFCKDCGKCCSRLPGGYLPSDITPEKQEQLLRDRLAVWDWYASFPNDRFYLRPANKTEHAEKRRFASGWPMGTPCVYLGKNGCTLSFDDRPFECKELKATAPGECSGITDTQGKNFKLYLAEHWEASGRGFSEQQSKR